MCFVLVAINVHSELPLVVAANRDEFYARPARTAHWWDGEPAILAGRDETAGGSWFGVRQDGRFATVTNLRVTVDRPPDPLSRGELVTGALRHPGDLQSFVAAVVARGARYNPFNLLCGDRSGIWYVNNLDRRNPRRLDHGVYALANADLDAPWPKLIDGKRRFEQILRQPDPTAEALFTLLGDCRAYPDHRLPDTGIPLRRERALSPIFIIDEDYGTRCSTVFMTGHDGASRFEERNHAGRFTGPGVVSEQFGGA